ncbi:MAG: YlmC/YmxH family sporulation protein [Clostridiales bacterium]|nr:YlmC/YmxH family sporulation protein [Clostridiales bacterium]
MDLSFCSLRNKDVVNICDGKNLGNISDMIIDTSCGRVIGIVVPASKGFFNFFKSNNDIFIPYNRICKIGKDIILVDIIIQNCNTCNTNISTDNQCNCNPCLQNFNIQTLLDNINEK